MKEPLIVASLVIAVGFLCCVAGEARAGAKLDWMKRVYADGRHNAFTDLAYWRGHYYLCFRHAASHMSMDGEIRVMRSADMRTWEPCGALNTLGDDRDPHFAATNDALYVYFGTWDLVHGEGPAPPDRGAVRTHCASTADGERWSEVRGVYKPGWWLWRVRWHDGAFYSPAYTAVRPKPSSRETRLLRSEDGIEWSLASVVTKERMAGEADVRFQPDGSMWLITRTGDGDGNALWFRSDPTRTTWESTNTGALVHAPVIAKWRERYFIAGRGRGAEGSVTRVWELVDGCAEEQITLPSGGDTSYPGLVADPASLSGNEPTLFISWYSQHERDDIPNGGQDTSSVYVGRIIVSP